MDGLVGERLTAKKGPMLVWKWIAVSAFCLIVSTTAFAAHTARLVGKVTDASGRPVEHATVMVYHAGVKTGYSVFCPGCYADCGKRAFTDSAGIYTFSDLDSDLWFELVVVRDGYVPAFVKKVDPSLGSTTTTALNLRSGADPMKIVRGRVLDPLGNPIRDVIVETKGVQTDRGTIIGVPPGLDPLALTNDKGEFETTFTDPVSKMLLFVEARTMAPKFVVLPAGGERQTVQLSEGAVIRGRLVAGGKGVGGAEIGLIAENRGGYGPELTLVGNPFEEMKIGTQEDGSFAITNVPSQVKWYVYGKMASLVGRGATEPVLCSTTTEKVQVDVGDIEVKPGHHLQGNVLLSDGKSMPDGMRIHIWSVHARDFQTSALGSDGHFEFTELALGDYTVDVSVKGYTLANGLRSIPVFISRDVDGWSVVLSPQSNLANPR